jgi:SAM-dependent methyltransferase
MMPRLRGRDDHATDFDAYADAYAATVQRSIDFSGLDHDFFTRRKVEHVVDLARRWVGEPQALRVLDVGCGVGTTDTYLAGRFGRLEGVDTSSEAIERAASTNPSVRYFAYDGESIPYERDSFDLAFAICVLHHVTPGARPQFAAEMRRVVRPGGLVAVFEHNPYNPLTRFAVDRCEFDADAVLVRAATLRRLLRSAGLRPVERRYVILLPSNRSRVRALEQVVAGLPLAAQYYIAALRPAG